MMHQELKLARNLLRDDGLIFISIDDHEKSNLLKVYGKSLENLISLVPSRELQVLNGGGFDGLTNMVDYIVTAVILLQC